MSFISPVYAESLGNITGVGTFQSGANSQEQTGRFLSTVIGTMTTFGSLAFVIYFFVGAIKWITAGGDKNKVAEAQSQMTQGAIGLIAMVASYFIVGLVGNILGLDILNPIQQLQKVNH